MVGNFNAHLSSTNRTAREDISRYIDLNNTIYQQNLIVMWDTPFNTNRTHIFFQVPWIFIKIDYILEQKYQKI